MDHCSGQPQTLLRIDLQEVEQDIRLLGWSGTCVVPHAAIEQEKLDFVEVQYWDQGRTGCRGALARPRRVHSYRHSSPPSRRAVPGEAVLLSQAL